MKVKLTYQYELKDFESEYNTHPVSSVKNRLYGLNPRYMTMLKSIEIYE